MKYCLIAISVLLMSSDLIGQYESKRFSAAGFYGLTEKSGRQVYSFNNGWYFYKGDIKHAEQIDFEPGNNWQQVQLPHGTDLLPEEASGGINYQGIVWYRKKFKIPPAIANKKISLHFEAIMGKCKIWLNGKLVKEHKGGYLPVIIEEPTSSFKKETDNVIAVMADNRDDPAYPPGKAEDVMDFTYFGGIYRDAWLIATEPVYISNANAVNKVAGGGVFVHYEDISKEKATVKVNTDVTNETGADQQLFVETTVKDADNTIIATATSGLLLTANHSGSTAQTLVVVNPRLWHPDAPYLYKIYSIVRDAHNKTVDGYYQNIGIRSIAFRGNKGFYLNGEPFGDKLIGANRHQDFAYIGNAMTNNLHWRDAKKLRDAGIRIIRSSHYPQDPAFMDACDQLGLFVIVATPGWQFWNKDSTFANYMYEDVRQMIRRDRNHACVIAWEPVPNETHYPADFAEKVYHITHEEYPYPGCIAACDNYAAKADIFDVLYAHPSELKSKKFNQSTFTREWGDNVDNWNAQNSSSRVALSWGEIPQLIQAIHYANPQYTVPFTSWESLYESPVQHTGGCLWHAFDTQRGYHPDPFLGGIMDAFRLPKYSYYLFKSQQNPHTFYQQSKIENPYTLFIANDMTPFSPADVTVFTNCDSVRLIINGKDSVTQHPDAIFSMPHPPIVFKSVFDFMEIKKIDRAGKIADGKIVAKGFSNGKEVITTIKSPAKRKARIKLEVDLEGMEAVADGSTIIPVIAYIVDENGNVKRLSDDLIEFIVEGEGEIIGDVYTAANPKRTEWGAAAVLIRTTLKAGNIKLIAQPAFKGNNTVMPDTLTINTIKPAIPSIYNEEDLKKDTGLQNSAKDKSAEQKKLTEKERQQKLKQVEKDQEIFEGNSKHNQQ